MPEDTDTILVTGATGNQGGAVARELLASGHKVRAMTRTPEGVAAGALAAQGAELGLQTGDFDALSGLSARLPTTAAVMLLASVTAAAAPPFATFVSEFLLYLAAVRFLVSSRRATPDALSARSGTTARQTAPA